MINKERNLGGVNGTGEGVVNINSNDYKALQKAIQAHAKKQTPQEKLKYELIGLKLQLENYIELEKPSEIIETGVFLKKYLQTLNIKNKAFANYIDVEETNLSMILNGKRKINVEFAYKLGQIFEVNPNYWLLIQSKNELLQMYSNPKNQLKKYRLSDLLEQA